MGRFTPLKGYQCNFYEELTYIDHPTCKIDFKALGDYIKKTGKKSGWDLTKEEMKLFEAV